MFTLYMVECLRRWSGVANTCPAVPTSTWSSTRRTNSTDICRWVYISDICRWVVNLSQNKVNLFTNNWSPLIKKTQCKWRCYAWMRMLQKDGLYLSVGFQEWLLSHCCTPLSLNFYIFHYVVRTLENIR